MLQVQKKCLNHYYFFIGLELPQSDLDIVISSFENAVKFIPSNILSKLLAHLSYMKWVKLCKPIFTATIPLLKLVRFIYNIEVNRYL